MVNSAISGPQLRARRVKTKTAKSGPLRAVTTETSHDKSSLLQTDHLPGFAMSRWLRLDIFLFFLHTARHTSTQAEMLTTTSATSGGELQLRLQ